MQLSGFDRIGPRSFALAFLGMVLCYQVALGQAPVDPIAGLSTEGDIPKNFYEEDKNANTVALSEDLQQSHEREVGPLSVIKTPTDIALAYSQLQEALPPHLQAPDIMSLEENGESESDEAVS